MLAEFHEATRILKHAGSLLAKDVTTLIALALCVGGIVMGSAGLALIVHNAEQTHLIASGEL